MGWLSAEVKEMVRSSTTTIGRASDADDEDAPQVEIRVLVVQQVPRRHERPEEPRLGLSSGPPPLRLIVQCVQDVSARVAASARLHKSTFTLSRSTS
uniref:Uncharacterized protein n=1 Tax=Oryza rufipogon TaxID=4529 RepID=A0A0E0NLL1_ORYRU